MRWATHLQSIGEVAYTCAFAIGMSYDDHFVAPQNQTLCQVVDVTLYPTHVRVEKVRHHTVIEKCSVKQELWQTVGVSQDLETGCPKLATL